MVDVFHQALECYENRRWLEGIEGFEESIALGGGGPSVYFLDRCKSYSVNAPPDDWDGVSEMREK
jgi:hypothetical protein